MDKPGKKEGEETELGKGGEEEDRGTEGKTESPLDKYMKIILEARKKQKEVSFRNVYETLSFFHV